MSTDEKWQQLQYGNETFDIQVYPGVEGTQGIPYVLLEDVKDHFPDASKFMIGKRLVSFMRDANSNRLMPLRFAYQSGMIVEIATTESSALKAGVSQESSLMASPLLRASQDFSVMCPRQPTRQNIIYPPVSPTSDDNIKSTKTPRLRDIVADELTRDEVTPCEVPDEITRMLNMPAPKGYLDWDLSSFREEDYY
ncbi:hypothetical protein BGZ68_010763 [Mortierella alpina]|nr:hypothetical protein BGZ68_010763 [Mortierella alpina]